VYDHVVRGAEHFEVFLGEIRNFERSVGEPIVIGGAEGMVGSGLHAGRDFPAGWHGDGKFDGAVLAVNEIHPDGGAADEGVELVVLRDIVSQGVGEDLVGNRDGGGAGKINLPGLAIGLSPGELLAAG
jgi:hypothetical protein